MKRAVSVSLGSSERDHVAELMLDGEAVLLERRGTDGDLERARRLLAALDGQVDALGLGGLEIGIDIGERRYALRQGTRLATTVRHTPIVDGSGLRGTLERRVFDLLGDRRPKHRYARALVAVGAARWGLAEAVAEVAEVVFFADLYLALGLPVRLRGLASLHRMSRALMPLVRHLPISVLYPTSSSTSPVSGRTPSRRWTDYDLLAGDFQYVRRCLAHDLRGKTLVTNTTTSNDVAMLRERGLDWLITTTPRLQGRSFGTNAIEAALVARAGRGRALDTSELWTAAVSWDVRPEILELNEASQPG